MNSKDRYDPTSGILTVETPEVKRPAGSILMSLLGFLMLVAAPLLAVGPTYLPDLGPIAEAVARYGVGLDVLALGGLALVGLGSLAGYQVRHTRTLLEPGLIEHDLEHVDAGLREMQSRIKELRDEDTLLRQEMLAVSKMVADLRESTARDAADSKNAIFRLAASLDQLGQRVDQKVEQGTIAVGEKIFEATGIIEASRDYLQESIEEMVREFSSYIFEALEVEADAGAAALPANPPSGAAPTRARLAEPAPGPDDLEICVTFEEDQDFECGIEECEPPTSMQESQDSEDEAFASGSIDSGLGLLDELEDPDEDEDGDPVAESESLELEAPASVPGSAGAQGCPSPALTAAIPAPIPAPLPSLTPGGLILEPEHPRAPGASLDGIKVGAESPAELPPGGLGQLKLLTPEELRTRPLEPPR